MATSAEQRTDATRVRGRPLVSVVIPTYNRAKWVSKAIDSVLAQTFTDFELLVVDDGSTDQSRQVISAYGSRLHYIYQDNRGVSTARNRGILEARGEWVAFLDSDDEWVPEKLQTQMNLVDRHPQLVMVASDAHIGSGDNRVTLFDIREQVLKDETKCVIDRPLLTAFKTNFFPSSFVVKKDALLQVGMFDETLSYGEDRDLACRVALLGPLGVVAKPLVSILSRGGGDVNLSTSQESDPRNRYRLDIVVCAKLLGSDDLAVWERSFVERCLSGDRFYCGMEEFRRGKKREGLSLMWRSCRDYPSIIAIVRMLIFCILGYSGLARIQQLTRGNGYKRSEVGIDSATTTTLSS